MTLSQMVLDQCAEDFFRDRIPDCCDCANSRFFRVRKGFVSSLAMKMPLAITRRTFDDLVIVLIQARCVAHGAKRSGHPVDEEKRFSLFQLPKNI